MAIQSKITDGIGLITLDRPEKANAYDRAHLESLQAKFQHLSDRVKVVVIHSAHSRFFCAGADLDEMRDAKPADAGLQGLASRWTAGTYPSGADAARLMRVANDSGRSNPLASHPANQRTEYEANAAACCTRPQDI